MTARWRRGLARGALLLLIAGLPVAVMAAQTDTASDTTITIRSRIVNGKRARPAQFPFQVALFFKDDGVLSYHCGGTLVAPSWILTAAHCVFKDSGAAYAAADIRVMVPWPCTPGDGKEPGSCIKIDPEAAADKAMFLPLAEKDAVVLPANAQGQPAFDLATLKNDIVLLRLAVPATSVAPVTLSLLSEQQAKAAQYPRHVRPYVVGWGDTNRKPDSQAIVLSPALMYAPIELALLDECMVMNTYPEVQKSKTLVTQTNVCARPLNWDDPYPAGPCEGDSGGPLLFGDGDRDDVYVQMGIVSWASRKNCLSYGTYSVYTRISTYAQFIADTVRIRTGNRETVKFSLQVPS